MRRGPIYCAHRRQVKNDGIEWLVGAGVGLGGGREPWTLASPWGGGLTPPGCAGDASVPSTHPHLPRPYGSSVPLSFSTHPFLKLVRMERDQSGLYAYGDPYNS